MNADLCILNLIRFHLLKFESSGIVKLSAYHHQNVNKNINNKKVNENFFTNSHLSTVNGFPV